MAGMGRKARWRGRVFFTRTELGKIWWWRQCAWPFVICELAVEQCGKGRLFFLYSDEFVDTEIDFLKIDVEGGEKNVLLGADYKKYRPRIILIEATIPFRAAQDYRYNPEAIASCDEWEYILCEAGYTSESCG